MPGVTIHPPGDMPQALTQHAAETAPAPRPAPQPAKPGIRYATDAQGRQIGWRKLNALEDFDLTEMAGAASGNEEWMLRASLAFGVREIDGEAVSRPTSKNQLRALVARLDDDGMAAVLAIVSDVMKDAGAQSGDVERAKN